MGLENVQVNDAPIYALSAFLTFKLVLSGIYPAVSNRTPAIRGVCLIEIFLEV
jgi:hypothetical protein